MFSFIGNLFNSTLAKNLVNHYTGGGVIIGVMALVQAGVIPQESINLVTGMNAKQLLPWLEFAVALWIITHIHIVNLINWLLDYKVSKATRALTLTELNLKKAELLKQIKELENEK